MHDIKQIRLNADYLINALCKRGHERCNAEKIVADILRKDEHSRKLQLKKQSVQHAIKKISFMVYNNSQLLEMLMSFNFEKFNAELDNKFFNKSNVSLDDISHTLCQFFKPLSDGNFSFFIILPDEQFDNYLKLLIDRLESFSFFYLPEVMDCFLQQVGNICTSSNNIKHNEVVALIINFIKHSISKKCSKFDLSVKSLSKYSTEYIYNFGIKKIEEILEIVELNSIDHLHYPMITMVVTALVFNTINMLFYKSLDNFNNQNNYSDFIYNVEKMIFFLSKSFNKIEENNAGIGIRNTVQLNFYAFIENLITIKEFCKIFLVNENCKIADNKRVLALASYSKNLSKFLLILNEKDKLISAKKDLALLPNILDNSVPRGADENDNLVVKTWGNVKGKKEFGFAPKDHQSIAENLGMLDVKRAVRMSGERFVMLLGDLARLERALIAFMLDVARDCGYHEVAPPLMVSGKTMFGTGQLPKFGDDSYIATTESAVKNFAKKFLLESFNPMQSHGGIGKGMLDALCMINDSNFNINIHNSNDFEKYLKILQKKGLSTSGLAFMKIFKNLHDQFYMKEGFMEFNDTVNLLNKVLHEYISDEIDKFAEYSFDKDFFSNELRNIPTSEVALTCLRIGETIDSNELPIRFTASTPCFRSEAGSAGRDTHGMIRLHQFHKVELVSIVTSNASEQELERMTAVAESILEKLELPYRKILLCGGDTGFSAAKTYDLEVWLPSQGKYREISSCSNCKDFQARRMNTRHKALKDKEWKFVHTLNGSALAIGRTIAAILENFQDANGSIKLPAAIKQYMSGVEYLK